MPGRPVKPLVLISSNKVPTRVELFKLDGVSYTIADQPRTAIALQTLRIMAEQGQRAGESWMLENLLGKAAYDKLLAYQDLTIQDFEIIVDNARAVVFADLSA